MRYLWKNLKGHAKARGIEFTITFPQWEEFCRRTEYHIHHGRQANGLTVDRVDGAHGYHHWNIQVLTNSENAGKKYVPYFQKQSALDARIAALRRNLT